jgi:uncharacterized protein YecE (DUF72 family)
VIRIGPAGWSYADWEGIVYPKPKPRGFHPLTLLGRYFDLVEIDSSFYALPERKNCARWSELVGRWPDFRFTAKLPQALTHESGPEQERAALAREFLSRIAPLAEADRLLGLLAQFPISFQARAASWQRVEALCDWFDPGLLVFELRHASWYDAASLDRLARTGASLAHIDLPRSKSHPPDWFRPLGRLGYLRLHGRNAAQWFKAGAGRDQRYAYSYAPTELEQLAAKARRLAGEHDQTALVTNNHFEGQAVANALELKALLQGEPVAAPREWVRAFPRLAKLVKATGQGQMFEEHGET